MPVGQMSFGQYFSVSISQMSFNPKCARQMFVGRMPDSRMSVGQIFVGQMPVDQIDFDLKARSPKSLELKKYRKKTASEALKKSGLSHLKLR